MFNQKPKATSDNQCQKSFDPLRSLEVVDLTEEQMESYCGGSRGVIFWFADGPISTSGGVGRQEEFQAELSTLRGRVE